MPGLSASAERLRPQRLRDSAVILPYNLTINEIMEGIIGASIEVHRVAWLESAYRRVRGVPFVCERSLPVVYKGLRLDCECHVDLIVADAELKTVQHWKVALLSNFNVALLGGGTYR